MLMGNTWALQHMHLGDIGLQLNITIWFTILKNRKIFANGLITDIGFVLFVIFKNSVFSG